MSGGHFDHKQYHINEIADEIERLIETNDSTEKNDYGDVIGLHYDEEVMDLFKLAVKHLRLSAILTKRIDWLVSCDDGPESFKRRVKEELEG